MLKTPIVRRVLDHAKHGKMKALPRYFPGMLDANAKSVSGFLPMDLAGAETVPAVVETLAAKKRDLSKD